VVTVLVVVLMPLLLALLLLLLLAPCLDLLSLSFRLPRLELLEKQGAKAGMRAAMPEGCCGREGGREGGGGERKVMEREG